MGYNHLVFEDVPTTLVNLVRVTFSNLGKEQSTLIPFASSVVLAHSKATLATWHHRLSHLHNAGVERRLEPLSVDGHVMDTKVPEGVCEGYVMGKSCPPPFPSSQSRADSPFDLVHTDICEMGVRNSVGRSTCWS